MNRDNAVSVVFIYFSLCFLFIFSIYSGTNDLGPDHHNYLMIIDRVANEEGFINKILMSKDAFFGVIIYIVNPRDKSEYYLVFLVICFISSISKLFLLPGMGRKFLFFIVLYWVLLAPGLEFTAIRSLLGLSFLLLYILFKGSNIYSKIIIVISILSHKSMVVPFLFQLDKVTFYHKKLGFIFYGVIVAVFSLIFSMVLHIYFSHMLVFGRLSGMKTAILNVFYILSPVSLIIFYKLSNVDFFDNKMLGLAYSLSVVGFFSFPTNIIADRFLEMSSFFMLVALFGVDMKDIKIKPFSFLFFYFSFVFIFIATLKRNTALDLWQVFNL